MFPGVLRGGGGLAHLLSALAVSTPKCLKTRDRRFLTLYPRRAPSLRSLKENTLKEFYSCCASLWSLLGGPCSSPLEQPCLGSQ